MGGFGSGTNLSNQGPPRHRAHLAPANHCRYDRVQCTEPRHPRGWPSDMLNWKLHCKSLKDIKTLSVFTFQQTCQVCGSSMIPFRRRNRWDTDPQGCFRHSVRQQNLRKSWHTDTHSMTKWLSCAICIYLLSSSTAPLFVRVWLADARICVTEGSNSPSTQKWLVWLWTLFPGILVMSVLQ